ncbi:MAG: M14 family zinc carboxypeptidase [Bacteroidota bacterium]
MQQRLFYTLFLLWISSASFAQIQSPTAFMPHPYMEQFTPHHLLVDYVEYVAENSPRVQMIEYGRTNQHRPLKLAFISTPENLAQLEAIRINNLKRTGLIAGEPDSSLDRAIVWLSFGVHGNEGACSESALAILYELVRSDRADVPKWLNNTIVLFDPSLNPDGYSRYTHWYRNASPSVPDPNPYTKEHNEPWPGGRVNHYLFDLNRDWAWQTQVESQERIKQYMNWMPHIHADFHEQGYNSPYYFAPAAKPFHDYITDWQDEFQYEVGRNNAKYFDQNGWLYFTRERFDLFYPSYGDTYPIFHGAIGMTYEQGGHSRAGRAIIMENDDILTLADRITHHTIAGISAVEVASKNADKLVEMFGAYFDAASNNPQGTYKTYIIKGDNPAGRIKGLIELLDKNQIRYGKATRAGSVKAFDYQTGKERNIRVADNDLVISAYQPLSVLTQVLMEPNSNLEDSLTYDITAWSLPYAYGLEAYATQQQLSVSEGYTIADPAATAASPKAPYAYLMKWHSMEDARMLAALMKTDIKVRFTSAPFELEGESYAAGTLVATRADNRKMKQAFDRQITQIAKTQNIQLIPVQTGFSDKGHDIGSGLMRMIDAPKIAVLSGESTSSYSFGHIWHYFEQSLDYPISIFDADDMGSIDWSQFNTLILPEGRYRFSESQLDELNGWISGGGRLIAIGWALSSLEGKKGFSLKRYASDEDERNANNAREIETMSARTNPYDGQERRWITNMIPGAIVKLKLDNTHPLGFGQEDYYFTLKTSSRAYQLNKDIWNVGYVDQDPMITGFVGHKAKEAMLETVVFGVQDKRSGAVIYMVDNPLFRGFWENGKLLFSNAVFFVGMDQ